MLFKPGRLLAWAFTGVYVALLLTTPFKGFTAFAYKALNISVHPSMSSYVSNVFI